ncbi:MAG: VWA domain-containing protein [Epsilonproteobacteria bacterium]|nr:VWA domain-containing protein [Campylobacterota bacterium]
MSNHITFEHPYAFLIILIFLICAKFCKERSEAIFFPKASLLFEKGHKKDIILTSLKWGAIVLAVFALASPVRIDQYKIKRDKGYALAIVLDASASMRYPFSNDSNQPKSKFDIAKELSKEFIKKRAADQIGLIVFGNFAYTAAPLTYDHNILNKIINSLYSGIAGPNYTVINEALFQTAKLFSKSKAKTKVAIFLTDGKSRGDVIPFKVALNALKKHKVKVYTIGIGKDGDFDEVKLQTIAKETGGEFFSAADKESLKKIYDKIDSMEKSEIKSGKYVHKEYLFELPLFLALMFLLVYLYLINRRGVA